MVPINRKAQKSELKLIRFGDVKNAQDRNDNTENDRHDFLLAALT